MHYIKGESRQTLNTNTGKVCSRQHCLCLDSPSSPKTASASLWVALVISGWGSGGHSSTLQCAAASTSQPGVSTLLFLCVGHESPYSIQVSHIRAGLKNAPTVNIQESVNMELVPQEMGCQFTLRWRHQDNFVPQNGESLLLLARVCGGLIF